MWRMHVQVKDFARRDYHMYVVVITGLQTSTAGGRTGY